MKTFPIVEGRPTFSDDWGNARSQGRTHQGTDIFAPTGTPVVAVDDGDMRQGSNKLGGNTIMLTVGDRRYYYAHLDHYEGGDRSVNAGDVIGYVGTTGNAAGGTPHLHFGIYPLGPGEPTNPYPELQALVSPTVEVASKPASSGGMFAAFGAVLLGGFLALRSRRK